ncbi:50S ribosomal protein L13 [Haliangium ochraceum]|uniref:Large ribosomal subunit protein uL13 n=1 Tax=Haliangium ochraceum (strain DSM 14365 / JCM 11303 / SMP-2) TaxID=502025 RepID=D0LJF2_HALO1|nr:50S ribosomal protein L13 [Haliangium ochraceum]ACY16526.1 ribosomal protein L13 [Haliangium ochraceum DSM 14365]
MQKLQTSTWVRKEDAITQRGWYVVDLEGQILGRAATRIAEVLRGKHKPSYTPNVDMGDFVVVVNADKVKLTGGKMQKKLYRYHTQYPGGLRSFTAEKLIQRHPEDLIRSAVRGMLPKNRLGRKMLKKLKVFAGTEHKHGAQEPKPLALR